MTVEPIPYITVVLSGGPADKYRDDIEVMLDESGEKVLPDELAVDDLDEEGKQVGLLLYSDRQPVPDSEHEFVFHFDSVLEEDPS